MSVFFFKSSILDSVFDGGSQNFGALKNGTFIKKIIIYICVCMSCKGYLHTCFPQTIVADTNFDKDKYNF